MADELKLCPFCGSHAQDDFIEDESYIIECYGCEASTGQQDGPQAAIDAWNRRAAPSSPVADDGREGAAQTGPKSAETRMDAGSQVLFAVADDGLPACPEPDLCIDASDKWWCEESVRQAQREAYEAGRGAGAGENCRCSEKVQVVQEQQPATVLDLIAEVERLSAALEARIEEGKDNA